MIDSSKICAINNEAKYGTGVIGYVLYHGNEKEFSIELDEALSLSDVPIFFETFIKNRTFTITDHFARKWVDQRIVPKNRQNLGMILKEAGLNEYDPYALLLWGGGRSSQDDCRITRCDEKNAVFPLWFTKRLDEKIMYLCPLSKERALVSLKSGVLYLIGLRDPKNAYISAGGDAILNNGKQILQNTELKETGNALPLTMQDLMDIISDEVVPPKAAENILSCSRQNLNYLTSRGIITNILSDSSHRLYWRHELGTR